MSERANLNMTPQSRDKTFLGKCVRLHQHNLPQVFSMCQRTDCQDQWLVHVWATELKPNAWLISGFIFTPKLPLSQRCSVMKCMGRTSSSLLHEIMSSCIVCKLLQPSWNPEWKHHQYAEAGKAERWTGWSLGICNDLIQALSWS